MNSFTKLFEQKFEEIYQSSRALVEELPHDKVFSNPGGNPGGLSCGEYILRSAGRVEQTFGGITARLWDDPFEWTLPEELSTKEKILQYLDEVNETRKRGFAYFESDEDLKKEIAAPEELTPIAELLVDTIVESRGLLREATRELKLLQGA
ncbi:MAG: hypothetical protein HKN25_05070 [Pyrinomonadaceae bacterium]|nr:hypothetical protein [Pyrinomonadaceae bacterium]